MNVCLLVKKLMKTICFYALLLLHSFPNTVFFQEFPFCVLTTIKYNPLHFCLLCTAPCSPALHSCSRIVCSSGLSMEEIQYLTGVTLRLVGPPTPALWLISYQSCPPHYSSHWRCSVFLALPQTPQPPLPVSECWHYSPTLPQPAGKVLTAEICLPHAFTSFRSVFSIPCSVLFPSWY